MVFKSIIGATLMLILSTTVMADWTAVSGKEEGLYWLLEKETGKLIVTRSDIGTTTECKHNLSPSGSGSYDIIKGTGRRSPVLVIDTIGARYVPCELQVQQADKCTCGQKTTFHRVRPKAPSAPINLQ